MRPVEIADSDDDGGGSGSGSDSLSGPDNDDEPVAAEVQTRSSDRASHATASTDPAFFQRVFEEQKQAAYQRTDSMSMSGSNPALSGSNPVERQCCGASAAGEASTTRRQQRMAESNDMWDVPSSPESIAKSAGQQAKTATTIKITRGLRRNVEMLGYESDEDGGGKEPRRTKRAKRMRLHSPNDSVKDGANIASAADENSSRAEATSGLVSTMPTNDPTSLYIAPKALSESQKNEYESVQASQNSPPERTAKSKRPPSGTAENFDTPRGNQSSTQAGGLTQAKRRTPRRRRDSSPDVIALEAEQVRASSAEEEAEQMNESLLGQQGGNDNDDDPDFAPRTSQEAQDKKKKKKRGRPPRRKEAKTAAASQATVKARGKSKKKESAEQVVEPVAEDVRILLPGAEAPPPQHDNDDNDDDDNNLPAQATKVKAVPAKDEATKAAEEKTAKKTAPCPAPPSVSTPGKPSYRVGLSRRLRIEPLLKSFRK
ncbi:hypothetical protein XA68_13475 [Ophiocordyceps unilateralis]|uniref:AT hook domain-containing protein n=1 Tax=Ophiocordyceps unilateralis TaxID=268505 RepID=A0A2A9PCE8_OPHUN|nr:hypothetical protein XA68_13475 [Ophiocordyceps unilateralis]